MNRGELFYRFKKNVEIDCLILKLFQLALFVLHVFFHLWPGNAVVEAMALGHQLLFLRLPVSPCGTIRLVVLYDLHVFLLVAQLLAVLRCQEEGFLANVYSPHSNHHANVLVMDLQPHENGVHCLAGARLRRHFIRSETIYFTWKNSCQETHLANCRISGS